MSYNRRLLYHLFWPLESASQLTKGPRPAFAKEDTA